MIHSWDLFDTLIGRKCGTAQRLFEQIGRIIEMPSFPEKRRKAEHLLQEQGAEYSLEDIYRKYKEIDPDFAHADDLAGLEYELELYNVYSIKRNARHLRNEDVIVSDMYLSEIQLRRLLVKAGIEFTGRIYVSCYGKHTGEVWGEIQGGIISHCGDNPRTDIASPVRAGLRTKLANTELSATEEFYLSISPDLAWWVHQHRLQNLVDENITERLDLLQNQYNIPLLYTACHSLRRYALDQRIEKLLFMSRDGQLFQRMWAKFYPEIPSEYLYISRECLRGSSIEYFNYLNTRYTKNTALVDLASSCGSLKIALPHLSNPAPKIWTMVFLPNFKVDLSGIDMNCAVSNQMVTINNTWLEMLNYADHWHVADVCIGKPIFDQPNEYSMDAVKKYHALFTAMLSNMPHTSVPFEAQMYKKILPAIHAEGAFLKRTFPNHLIFEASRKKYFEKMSV